MCAVLKAPRGREERPVTLEDQDHSASEDQQEPMEGLVLKALWVMLVPLAMPAIWGPPDPPGPREALVSQESRASWVSSVSVDLKEKLDLRENMVHLDLRE